VANSTAVRGIGTFLSLALLLYMFWPTAIVLAIGLIPTALMLAFDQSKERYGVVTVGAMNLAGVVPTVVSLWIEGHSLPTAFKLLGNPINGAVIVLTSAIGVAFLLSAPIAAAVIIKFRIRRQIDDLKRRQVELEDTWSAEVGSVAAAAEAEAAAAAEADAAKEAANTDRPAEPPKKAATH
jgi:hypothetical protein